MSTKPSKVIATAGPTPDTVLVSHTAFPVSARSYQPQALATAAR